ncbi:MAG TPA: prepilin-type N-terminal cleavage/methylation domain-containing protein, partial [Bacillota bacterium]|nr:prepilin-type N-terminal cleavage/methylation domain-containing protein [Bacillota bacterium]
MKTTTAVQCQPAPSGTREASPWLVGTTLAQKPSRQGFTLVELLAVVILLALGASMLLPALARTQPDTKAARCQNNLRQLTVAWHAWAEDHAEQLLSCDSSVTTRSNWMTGVLDFAPGNLSNWDL